MVDTIAKPPMAAGYDHDFYAWTQQQAAALRAATRAGANLPVDWENVAEEIESLGRSDARALGSRVATIIEHLLKLEFAPAAPPRRGWAEAVVRSRDAFETMIADSPSLRRHVPDWVETGHRRAARLAQMGLDGHGELDRDLIPQIAARRYTEAEILGDWFPQAEQPR